MEKSSEPTLAPQWLTSTRHVTSFVSASSPLRPDDPAPLKLANSRLLSMNMNNKELRNTVASDRAVQSRARWSSNSSTSPNFRSYNSFRSHRYRDMDKDINKYREASTLRNPRSRDLPDTSSKHCWETFKEEGLGRSQSMISGRISEKWPTNLSNAGKIKLTENKGLLSVSGVDKAIDRGIRPLVTEQRQASPRLERVESPGLGTMTRTLPTGALRTTDNKSASALADIAAVAGNSNSGPSSMKQGASSGPSSPISSKSIGRVLSMAETVAKGPSRVQTTSQLSNANQRLEELAVKQSRQLIPLKSLVTKASVSNPSDKPRTKVELLQQTVSSSPPVSPSLSSKLHVFKPTRERHGVSSGMNGSLSPNTHSKGSNVLLTIPPANIAASSASGHKPVGTMVEKKLSSQARGRNDFFNLMRKKSIGSSSAVSVEGSVISPSSSYNSGVSEVLNAHGIPQDQDFSLSDDSPRAEQSTEILGENTCDSESSDGKNSTDKSSPKSEAILRSEEEEEAAFMRSLGWEENSDEGGLTEEEISAFYKDVAKYINSKLSYKVMQGVQSLLSLHSGIGDVGVISS
ncbi:putative vesicle-associated protein 1-4-like [Capsicum annuum]|nr:putative vesicle-associated protein 1-4-like [Capsicum annuum]